jgi:hypothetical protein
MVPRVLAPSQRPQLRLRFAQTRQSDRGSRNERHSQARQANLMPREPITTVAGIIDCSMRRLAAYLRLDVVENAMMRDKVGELDPIGNPQAW